MSSPQAPPAGGDRDMGSTINAVNWTFTMVALAAVCARLFGRIKLSRNLGWDDFWIMVSMVRPSVLAASLLSILYTAMATASINAGIGRHTYYMNDHQRAKAIRLSTIAFVPGILSVGVPKLAVACLLERLLNPLKMKKWPGRILYSLSICSIVSLALCAVILLVQCKPTAGLWNSSLKPKCWNPSVEIDYAIFSGAFSAFVDLYLAVYPMTVLFGLNMSMDKKVGCSCALGLGVVAAAVAIYKCTTIPELRDRADYTYATSGLEIVTSVEATVIIIAACLPTLRPVFLHFTGRPNSLSGKSKPLNPDGEYQFHSRFKNSGNEGLSIDPYRTDSAEYVQAYCIEDRILPAHAI
ncbi:hypothetical protein MMC28_009360 [Mycoblastus sanguinarius]|nr:hypothetical protein [Mycoblastus sanguinarius]